MEKTLQTKKGIFLVLLSAILWSLNTPFVKGLSFDPLQIACMRALIAGLALLPFLRLKKIRFNRYTLGMLLGYAGLSTCVVLGLKMTSTPIAVGTQFTAPVWLYLAERKLGGKRDGFKRLWPLCSLLFGIVLFMCSKAEGVTLKGNLVALSTSFSFALTTYCSPHCARENPLGMTSLCCLFTGLLLLPFTDTGVLFTASHSELFRLLLLGVVQTGLGYGCYYMGINYTSARSAAQIAPLEMILGPFWAALLFGEFPDLIGLLGFLFVLLGVFGEAFLSDKKEKRSL